MSFKLLPLPTKITTPFYISVQLKKHIQSNYARNIYLSINNTSLVVNHPRSEGLSLHGQVDSIDLLLPLSPSVVSSDIPAAKHVRSLTVKTMSCDRLFRQ